HASRWAPTDRYSSACADVRRGTNTLQRTALCCKSFLKRREETMSEQQRVAIVTGAAGGIGRELVLGLLGKGLRIAAVDRTPQGLADLAQAAQEDRKSTRLNSSHLVISYAVF